MHHVESIVKLYDCNNNEHRCYVIPPHLERAHRTHKVSKGVLGHDPHPTDAFSNTFRQGRIHPIQSNSASSALVKKPEFTVYSAKHKTSLPGTLINDVLREKTNNKNPDPYNAQVAANETYQCFLDLFHRNSIDDKGLSLVSTTDYGQNYNNAFWNGQQMVYGDGDNEIFNTFTVNLDVIGHELTHGMTQYMSNLVYEKQPGALNEHLSDVFGKVVQHYSDSKKATLDHPAEYDDIIGKGLILDYEGASYKGLRSMSNPGTAYVNHPVLGTDPQPGKWSEFKYMPNNDDGDNGGVHINSGIPNHAFWIFHKRLQERTIGTGNLWEIPAQLWYDTAKHIVSNCKFKAFADQNIKSVANIKEYITKIRADWAKVQDAARYAWKSVQVI